MWPTVRRGKRQKVKGGHPSHLTTALRPSPSRIRAEELVEQAREFIRQLKRDHPVCFDCGYKWPPFVLEFDHIDPSTKLFNVGDASSVPSMEALEEEVEKCDLVCSNCHKIREYHRKRARK